MGSGPVAIYKGADPYQALLLQQCLSEKGIWSATAGAALSAALDLSGWDGAVSVVVSPEDAALARQIAVAFERHILNAAETDLPQSPQDEPGWKDWPLCRQCQAPRQSACPVCETAGHRFALAYEPAPEGGPSLPQPPLVLCSTCDEAFRPTFYRTCAWCGCDHGEGLEAADESPDVSLQQLVGIVAVTAAAVLVYWWYWGRWW